MKKRIISLCLVMSVMFFVATNFGLAKEYEFKDESFEEKTIIGELISFSPKDKPTIIGVAVDAENTDYFFNMDEAQVKFINKNRFKDIQLGDTVEITYNEITQVAEEESRTTKVITKIKFLKPAKVKQKVDEDSLISTEE